MWQRKIELSSLLIILLIFQLSIAPVAQAEGCKCGDTLRQRDVLFVGTVIGKDSPLMYGLIGAVVSNLQGVPYSQGVIFDVEEAWEGVEREEITIRTGGGQSCGIAFERGQTYLVSATFGRNNHPQTSTCHTTLPINQAASELEQLSAEPTLPLEPIPRVTPFEAAIIAILLLLIYWWLFMIRAIRANPLRF